MILYTYIYSETIITVSLVSIHHVNSDIFSYDENFKVYS